MDDVLCAYDWPRRVKLLADAGGLDRDEVSAAIWGSGFEDAADRGEMDAQAYLAGFNARAGLALSAEDWADLRASTMTPDPDMLALVERLKSSVDVALLTNNGHLTFQMMDRLFPEMRVLFGDRLLVSAMLGTHKPDPAVYRRALERLGFAPGQTLFVDDKPENIEGAVAAGLNGHHFTGIQALRLRLEGLGLIV